MPWINPFFKLWVIFGFLFAVGGYSFTRQFDTHMKMYKKYGKIVREQFGEEFNFIRLYDEKVIYMFNRLFRK